jgi:hypothetical protein
VQQALCPKTLNRIYARSSHTWHFGISHHGGSIAARSPRMLLPLLRA